VARPHEVDARGRVLPGMDAHGRSDVPKLGAEDEARWKVKMLVTSDWHLDATTGGVDRFDDVSSAVAETVEAARAEEVDLYVFLGDLCDPDANRAPRCVSRAIVVARRLHGAGICSRWLVGNHDVIEDGSGSHTLAPMQAAQAAPTADSPGWCVVDRPMVERIAGVTFVWLPYVPRCASYDAGEFVRSVETSGTPQRVVVAGHLSIHGQVPGSETTDMPRGRDLWLPTDAIAQRWPHAVVMNGHYHRAQQSPVIIPGSLARLTFGEESHNPGFMIVEVP